MLIKVRRHLNNLSPSRFVLVKLYIRIECLFSATNQHNCSKGLMDVGFIVQRSMVRA